MYLTWMNWWCLCRNYILAHIFMLLLILSEIVLRTDQYDAIERHDTTGTSATFQGTCTIVRLIYSSQVWLEKSPIIFPKILYLYYTLSELIQYDKLFQICIGQLFAWLLAINFLFLRFTSLSIMQGVVSSSIYDLALNDYDLLLLQ